MKNTSLKAEGIKNRLRRVILYFLLLVIIFMFVSTARSIIRLNSSKGQVETARLEAEKLEEENRLLQERLEAVKETDFVEGQIRDKLGKVKEGETLVILPDEETVKSLAPKTDLGNNEPEKPNWRKWLDLFL